VHRGGSIDWCCLKRLDASSVFARLLDARRGGYFALAPAQAGAEPERGYLEGTLVLCTTWRTATGRAGVLDFLAVDRTSPGHALRQVVRVVEGLAGEVEFEAQVVPRFDYGAASPWVHDAPGGAHYAQAGDDALLVACEAGAERRGDHALASRFTVAAGERARLELRDVPPYAIDSADPPRPSPAQALDALLDDTIAWWRDWSRRATPPGSDRDGVLRSALVLRALTNPLRGAIAAAATTSLPESADGRTWDYRYSWVRDSVFCVRSLAALGLEDTADAFRRFIQRSSAGHADELLIAYGVSGERRMHAERWRAVRAELREQIEKRAYDPLQGAFTQSLDGLALDAAVLRLSAVGFLDARDERMVRTVDAIAAAHDLGLFSEEYDVPGGQPMGNVPQALTHFSHVQAALALERSGC
jgi:GH15 family glucan-1,4-alpha-glucosidase